MLLTTAHALADFVVSFPGSAGGPSPGDDMRGPSARYRIYDTADGWVFLAAPQPKEWDLLAKAVADQVDLRSDARFATEDDRRRNDDALAEALAAVFVTRTTDDWQLDLTAFDVACVAVDTGLNEPLLMDDEHGRASGYVVDVEHPTFGTHPRLAPVVQFSRSTTRALPGTLCGTATRAVLEELGYTEDEIADLRARKVVG
jgi:crotonobetainyl-CoA:carnitine CoA-transferase CaiB-like acyl-CoA transferase